MPSNRSISRFVPELSLFAASILWGASFLATKAGMQYTGPLGFVGLRYLAATMAFVALFLRVQRCAGRAHHPLRRRDRVDSTFGFWWPRSSIFLGCTRPSRYNGPIIA